tara:strand:- start:122637 stop:124403 length:1767 start_codon:yes stop_codon:yes gene_type:complete
MNFSLRAKISVASIIPVLAYLAMVSLQLNENYKRIKIANNISNNSSIFYASSKLIHELQKERGISVGFLNKGISAEVLSKQKAKTSEKISEFEKVIGSLNPKSATVDIISEFLGKLPSIRTQVESQTTLPADTFKFFTSAIAACISLEKELVNIEDTDGLLSRSRSLLVLETSKEEAGQLRATLTGIIASNKSLTDSQVEKITDYIGGVSAHLNSPSTIFLDITKKGIAEFNTSTEWRSVKQTAVSVIRLSNQGNFGLNTTDFFNTITKSIDAIADLIANENDALLEKVHLVYTRAYSEGVVLAAISAGLLLGIFVLVNFIITGITRPIYKTINSLNQSAEDVGSASTQLKTSSDVIATASTEAAASLEETVASLEELSSMVKINASNSASASQLSLESQKNAENGEQQIMQLISAINEMASSSEKIQAIVSVIDDVAFQTNLLALNAAVEAARAGEQGRGFAVVAEAVRSLAQRSSEQAKNISSLINENTEKVVNSSAAAKRSEQVLGNIVSSIKRMAALNSEISGASQEQSVGLGQITEAMNQLDQATQMNAGSAEESAASAQALANEALSLKNQVLQLQKIISGS